jgi:hypothetical protein
MHLQEMETFDELVFGTIQPEITWPNLATGTIQKRKDKK